MSEYENQYDPGAENDQEAVNEAEQASQEVEQATDPAEQQAAPEQEPEAAQTAEQAPEAAQASPGQDAAGPGEPEPAKLTGPIRVRAAKQGDVLRDDIRGINITSSKPVDYNKVSGWLQLQIDAGLVVVVED